MLHWSSYKGDTGCSNPGWDHPICLLQDKLIGGLERFEDTSAKVKALKAIGHQTNHLRWLAGEAIRSLAYMSDEQMKGFDWNDWWSKHSVVFEICTDEDRARRIAKQYHVPGYGLLWWGAQQCLEKLDE